MFRSDEICLFLAVSSYFNDLLTYNPVSMQWTDFGAPDVGIRPTARTDHGMASVGRLLYVFAGLGATGGVQNDILLYVFFPAHKCSYLVSFHRPRTVLW